MRFSLVRKAQNACTVGIDLHFHVYCGIKVNQTQKQHAVAIDLLEKLGLENIRLEQQRDGHYTYRAWNTPIVEHNGSLTTVKRGKIRIPPVLSANFPNRFSGK
jgi:hypothetical protein